MDSRVIENLVTLSSTCSHPSALFEDYDEDFKQLLAALKKKLDEIRELKGGAQSVESQADVNRGTQGVAAQGRRRARRGR